MNSVPESPAEVSLKWNFSTRKVGVQVRKIVATKFAARKASINSGTVGVRKMTRRVCPTESGEGDGIGVRPSPGAATSDSFRGLDSLLLQLVADVAAPEDGRTLEERS